MPTTLELLRTARDVISEPEHWTKGWYFRNADGKELTSHLSDQMSQAVSFCSLGAIHQANGGWSGTAPGELALQATLNARNIALSVPVFNDLSSHEEVLALFDETIARLEAEAVHV